MKQYLRYRCWDWILCILISVGLIVNILSGFEIEDVTAHMLVIVSLTVVLTLVYFLAAINKSTSIVGIIVGIFILIALLILCRNTNLFVNDQKYGMQIIYVITVVMSLAVFLICRTRAGIVFLFLVGNVVQAGASFLEFPCELWAYLLFLAGTGLMIFYRVYVISVLHSHTGKIRFMGFMTQNLCVCLTALVLASGIFVGIIKPLDPPTDELKLIQKLMSFEVLEKIGVSSVLIQVDENKESDQLPDDRLATDQLDDDEEEGDGSGKSQESQGNGSRFLSGNAMDSVAEQIQKAMAISYEVASYWYLFLIVIIALICFIIWFKQFLRKRWLDKIDQLPRAEGIMNLYAFFLYGLSKAGCAKAKNLTLDEFQTLNAGQLSKFDHEQVNFKRLTDIYRKAYYGMQSISEEEYEDFRRYYSCFHKNICKEVGKLKYIPLYFKL